MFCATMLMSRGGEKPGLAEELGGDNMMAFATDAGSAKGGHRAAKRQGHNQEKSSSKKSGFLSPTKRKVLIVSIRDVIYAALTQLGCTVEK